MVSPFPTGSAECGKEFVRGIYAITFKARRNDLSRNGRLPTA